MTIMNRFSKLEKGQGIIEFIIGIVIILILCSAALGFTTEFLSWTKKNISDMSPATATLPASFPTEEETLATESVLSTPNPTITPQEIESPVPVTTVPIIPTAPPSQPNEPETGVWERFLSWLDNLIKK